METLVLWIKWAGMVEIKRKDFIDVVPIMPCQNSSGIMDSTIYGDARSQTPLSSPATTAPLVQDNGYLYWYFFWIDSPQKLKLEKVNGTKKIAFLLKTQNPILRHVAVGKLFMMMDMIKSMNSLTFSVILSLDSAVTFCSVSLTSPHIKDWTETSKSPEIILKNAADLSSPSVSGFYWDT